MAQDEAEPNGKGGGRAQAKEDAELHGLVHEAKNTIFILILILIPLLLFLVNLLL